MKKKFNIAVDAMGGDNAPLKVIEGVDMFLAKYSDAFVNLYGDQASIEDVIKNFKRFNSENHKINHAPDKVPGDSSVRDAIKIGKNTSMWLAIDSVKTGQNDIIVSSGNTGALLVMSKLILKMMDGVDKPALAAVWPNHKDFSLVLDLGANVECNAQNLYEFSILGSELYKAVYNKENVVTALLNIGSEEIKGHDYIKDAHAKLSESNDLKFTYRGYIEGNEIKNGDVHVVVADGFTGNIALKTAEGTAKFITDNLKKSLTKISLLFSYLPLRKFKSKLDPRKYNGAIFLGLNGPVVKSHGGTDAVGFYYSIDLCYKIVKRNLMQQIKKNLSHLKSENL